VALLHEGEEEAHLGGFDLDVADLVDEEQVPAQVLAQDLFLGVEGNGLIEFGDQVGKEDVAAGGAALDGADQEAGGQAGLAAAGAAQPDDVLGLGQEVEGVSGGAKVV
jgi:hypothetical protein